MHNLIRYIRQNRKKIIGIAIIIAFLFIILQILNNLSKNNKKIEMNTANQNIFDKTNGIIRSDRSMVSGGSVSEKTMKNVNETVKEFVDKCNDNKPEEAYDMLTDNCKEAIYPNYEDFYENYYKNLFENNKKTYSIENWSRDIFIVRYTSDILSTGESIENKTYQDYLTVVEKDGKKKLNINKYIERVEYNKEKESDNIKIKVLYKDVFVDNEVYTMQITNNTNNTILMDTLKKTDGIYLKDDNDIRHESFSNELVKDDLKIDSRTYKSYKYKI